MVETDFLFKRNCVKETDFRVGPPRTIFLHGFQRGHALLLAANLDLIAAVPVGANYAMSVSVTAHMSSEKTRNVSEYERRATYHGDPREVGHVISLRR